MQTKTKNISVNFFKIEPKTRKDETNDLYKELTDIFLFKNKEYKNSFYNNRICNLYGNRVINKDDNSIILGAFLIISLEDIPQKGNIETLKIEDLNIEGEEEGIAYYTSFLFDKETNILMVTSKRNGVNNSDIIHFIRNNYDIPEFNFGIVTTIDNWREYLNKDNYRKLSIKLAHMTNIGKIIDNNNSVGDVLKLGEEISADTMTLTLENSKKKGGFTNIPLFKKAVNFFGKMEEHIQKLEVIGYDDDEPEQVYNFITGKLTGKITIEVSKFTKFTSISKEQEGLINLFNENKNMLRDLYSE